MPSPVPAGGGEGQSFPLQHSPRTSKVVVSKHEEPVAIQATVVAVVVVAVVVVTVVVVTVVVVVAAAQTPF